MTASNQWASRPADQRFQTLSALQESVHNRRLRSRATDIDISEVRVDERDGQLVVNSAISPVSPSNWSFQQLAGAIGAPAGYLRKLPTELVVKNINHGLENQGKLAQKFMTLAPTLDDAVGTLQAVTSPTYGRIWDADVVDAALRIVDRSGGRFYNPKAYVHDGKGLSGIQRNADGSLQTEPSGLYASDRDVFMFLIDGGSRLDVGERAQLNRGFFLWNSEVGSKTFGLTTFLFNQCCGNHIVYGAQNVNELIIRHSKGAPARFDNEAFPALIEYVDSSANKDEAVIRKAQEIELKGLIVNPGEDWSATSQPKLIAEWASAKKFKLTRAEIAEAIQFANREEGKFVTLWDLVQGLTAYARGFEFIDARTDLEKRAGQLLELAAA